MFAFPYSSLAYDLIPGTLSAKTSTGELAFKVGIEVVCTTDGEAVLVELDQEGYVVCH